MPLIVHYCELHRINKHTPIFAYNISFVAIVSMVHCLRRSAYISSRSSSMATPCAQSLLNKKHHYSCANNKRYFINAYISLVNYKIYGVYVFVPNIFFYVSNLE